MQDQEGMDCHFHLPIKPQHKFEALARSLNRVILDGLSKALQREFIPKIHLDRPGSRLQEGRLKIQKVLQNRDVQTYMAEKNIRWQFTSANSAKHNSITETLVKQSKLALYGVFKEVHMTESEFTTALKIAQGKMNQRPLVAISDNPEDQNLLTLTPAHLKLGKALMSLPSDFDKVDDVANLSLKSRWEQRKRL